jgi:hypothetical protein
MGQAAGACATLAAKHNVLPAKVPFDEVMAAVESMNRRFQPEDSFEGAPLPAKSEAIA